MLQDDQDIPRRGRFRDQRGAALVEFVICSTLFLVLIYGLISFGVIFGVKHTLTSAASEGARAAVGAPLNSGCSTPRCNEIAAAKAKADQVIDGGLGSRAVHVPTIAPTVATCAGSSHDCITVTVTYPYADHPVLPQLVPFLPETLSSTSVVELS
ncbi:MAG: TadE/TadG family type IV pilus assembly protein [Nocardioidaceae bacterium]